MTTVTLALVLAQSLVPAPVAAQVSALLSAPDKFDGRPVVVTGAVAKFMAKKSKKGNPYTTFDLLADNKKVSVYFRGYLDNAPKNGDKVKVSGIFSAVKKVGTMTFKNEVDASKFEGQPYGVVPIK